MAPLLRLGFVDKSVEYLFGETIVRDYFRGSAGRAGVENGDIRLQTKGHLVEITHIRQLYDLEPSRSEFTSTTAQQLHFGINRAARNGEYLWKRNKDWTDWIKESWPWIVVITCLIINFLLINPGNSAPRPKHTPVSYTHLTLPTILHV